MSITSDIRNDIRSYADTAVAEGRKVLDTTLATAQVQLQNVSAVANKAGEAVHDVRTSAEKAINADALRAAVAPYVAQAKGYQADVRDRADGIYTSLKKDERVGRVIDTAEAVTEVVVGTVQERVVKPVRTFTGRGTATKPTPARATKPATTRPATKPAAKKTATKSTTTRSAASKSTASKSTARKSTATSDTASS